MTRIGIDLGAAAMRCAALDAQQVPALVPDSSTGAFETPPFIAVDGETAIVGTVAQSLCAGTGGGRAFDPLARLGRPRDADFIDAEGQTWAPEALASVLLRKLVRDARAHTDAEVTQVVIAVDAGVSDEQLDALRSAAAIAGIAEHSLVERPVAVATHCLPMTGHHLVVDLGESGARVAVVAFEDSAWGVLAHEQDEDLGSRALDDSLAKCLLSSDSPAADERAFIGQLRKSLLQEGSRSILRSGLLGGRIQTVALTSRQLQVLIEPVARRVAERCAEVVQAAGLEAAQIASVVAVGGGAAWPGLESAIRARLRSADLEFILRQPLEAVVFGATRHAAKTSGEPRAMRVSTSSDGTPDDIGVRTWDADLGAEALQVVIARGSRLPCSDSTTIYTQSSDQRRVVVDIARAGDEGGLTSLGRFAFGPIRRPRANLPVEVEISITADGVVQASARSRETGESIDCELAGEGVPALQAEAARALQIE
jgi:molecular chaperone DnaK (HSP70)